MTNKDEMLIFLDGMLTSFRVTKGAESALCGAETELHQRVDVPLKAQMVLRSAADCPGGVLLRVLRGHGFACCFTENLHFCLDPKDQAENLGRLGCSGSVLLQLTFLESLFSTQRNIPEFL